MNDFPHGLGDEEASEAFGSGFVPSSEPPATESVPKNEANSTVPKPDVANDAPATNASEHGAAERTGSSVYIANLQWWTTDADVERLCSTYGPVVNINFLAERSNGKSKGVALVEFADNLAAARCKEGLSG